MSAATRNLVKAGIYDRILALSTTVEKKAPENRKENSRITLRVA
jgi:hypothetical protein